MPNGKLMKDSAHGKKKKIEAQEEKQKEIFLLIKLCTPESKPPPEESLQFTPQHMLTLGS